MSARQRTVQLVLKTKGAGAAGEQLHRSGSAFKDTQPRHGYGVVLAFEAVARLPVEPRPKLEHAHCWLS
jgi:hypothetical protein